MGLTQLGLEGKYEIVAKLNEGGMGAIYKVRHRLLDEIRVVKVLRPQHEDDQELRERFAREARSAIRLRHPNVVQLFDFSLDDSGAGLIVMEHIAGVDLSRLVQLKRLPSLPLALEIGRQSLRSLGFLHQHGFVHRDVSPDNLMLTCDVEGRPLVKLIDLGIAKNHQAEQTLTVSGSFLGKFRYASPEHFGAQGPDGTESRSDLYTFGLVFYEVLTGRYAMPGESTSQLIASHLFEKPIDFATSDPEGRLPERLRVMLRRALEKQPDDRYPDAKSWIAEIRELQRDYPLDSGSSVEAAELATLSKEGTSVEDGSTQGRFNRAFGGEHTPRPSVAPTVAAQDPMSVLLAGAEALFQLGREEQARQQVETILSIEAEHAGALELLERLDSTRPQRGSLAEGADDIDDAGPQDIGATEILSNGHTTPPPPPPPLPVAGSPGQLPGFAVASSTASTGDASSEAGPSAAGSSAAESSVKASLQPKVPNTAIEGVETLMAAGELLSADLQLVDLEHRHGDAPPLPALRARLDTLFHDQLTLKLRALLTEADNLVDDGDYPEALGRLRDAKELAPKSGPLHEELTMGVQALRHKIEFRERQLAIHQIERHVLNQLQAGDLEGAREELRRAEHIHGADEVFDSLRQIIAKALEEHLAEQVAEAGRALADEDYGAAIGCLEAGLQLDPANAWVKTQLQRARTQLEQRKAQAKRAEAERNADLLAVRGALEHGDLVAAQQLVAAAADRWGDDAVEELRESIRQRLVRSLLDRAERAQHDKDLYQARQLVSEASALAPDDTAIRRFSQLLDDAVEDGVDGEPVPLDDRSVLLHTVADIERLRVEGAPLEAWKAVQQAIVHFGEKQTLLDLRRQLAEHIMEEAGGSA